MVDQNTLVSRLSALEEYCAKLETFREYNLDEFLDDGDIHHLAERYLHLACECMIDIGQHIISDLGFRTPSNYQDVMEVLREEGVLDDALSVRLRQWMGFRNILVHLYLVIDHEKSYQAITEDLDEIRAFLRIISQRYLIA